MRYISIVTGEFQVALEEKRREKFYSMSILINPYDNLLTFTAAPTLFKSIKKESCPYMELIS